MMPQRSISEISDLTHSVSQENLHQQILGIRFFTGSAQSAAEIGTRGGLVVVPAAPALINLESDHSYREALLNADLAITDSSFMVLLWNVIQLQRIKRVSGLEYLKIILKHPALCQPRSIFWIMPSVAAMETNLRWLSKEGHSVSTDDCYVAPHYDADQVIDPALLEIINRLQPPHIIIALGGGVQEKLGYYLKQNATYRPAIHCIGAAIGFLSGEQVKIPMWADRLYMGWFFRCCHQPAKFVPRYWKARGLVTLMMKHWEQPPVSVAHQERKEIMIRRAQIAALQNVKAYLNKKSLRAHTSAYEKPRQL